MSEDRTQAPTRRRRQQARERGQVARSPELTGAVGLLAAVVLLGAWGGDLAAALVAAVREPLIEAPGVVGDASEIVARLRHLAWGIAAPLGMIAGGVVVAMVTAHQIQVGGLWVPGLLAPQPQRLWTLGTGAGFTTRLGRGAWSLAKSALIVVVAAWAIRANVPAFEGLSRLEAPALARASGALLRNLAYALAVATLALGAMDFARQYFRVEALLRLTPEEHREELRSVDGDPAVRARRRQLARAWRHDPAEVLAGAALVLLGSRGLTVVLAGGPPPRRITVRSVARGAAGASLRRTAARAGLASIDAPPLAQHLARGPATGMVLPPEVIAELTALWPRSC